MLNVTLKIQFASNPVDLCGEIANCSRLAALSDYECWFEVRPYVGDATLQAYPRWAESVLGLVVRCLALTHPPGKDCDGEPLPPDWSTATIQVDLVPGGRGQSRLIAEALLLRNDVGAIEASASEMEISCAASFPPRSTYADSWELAEHGMRMLVFGSDALPEVKPLEVPVLYMGERGMPYIRSRDIANPYARAAFEHRQRSSGRPCIDELHDASWAWDWTDWDNGQR